MKIITVEEVKKLAMEHYEKGGDVVIECLSDKDIQNYINGSTEEYEFIKPYTTKKDWLNYFKLQDEFYNEYREW